MSRIAVKVFQPKQLKRRNLKKFRLEFFQVSSFQPLRLKNFHCDDLHIILSLSAVQIYEFHILIFKSMSVRNFCFKPSQKLTKHAKRVQFFPAGLAKGHLEKTSHRFIALCTGKLFVIRVTEITRICKRQRFNLK